MERIHAFKYEIDDKDRQIMRVLFNDGRMSIAEISKRTSIRRDSVARRLKRLVEEKIITTFVPIIEPSALGLPNVAILLLRLKAKDEHEKNTFQMKLISNDYIVHISKILGKYDYYCSILYKNMTHLNEIIEEIKNYVPNIIDEFEIYQGVEDPKFEDMRNLL